MGKRERKKRGKMPVRSDLRRLESQQSVGEGKERRTESRKVDPKGRTKCPMWRSLMKKKKKFNPCCPGGLGNGWLKEGKGTWEKRGALFDADKIGVCSLHSSESGSEGGHTEKNLMRREGESNAPGANRGRESARAEGYVPAECETFPCGEKKLRGGSERKTTTEEE